MMGCRYFYTFLIVDVFFCYFGIYIKPHFQKKVYLKVKYKQNAWFTNLINTYCIHTTTQKAIKCFKLRKCSLITKIWAHLNLMDLKAVYTFQHWWRLSRCGSCWFYGHWCTPIPSEIQAEPSTERIRSPFFPKIISCLDSSDHRTVDSVSGSCSRKASSLL